MHQPFWKPKPIPPGHDWISPFLRVSLYVSTAGWIVYGVFALAFDDIAVIPATVQSWLVIAGSVLIVAGAEMNTAPTVVAVARKWGAKKAQGLDALAFCVSLIGSITAGLIAFSIRQTRLGEVGWRALALDVGPLVVGIAIACDFYAASIELGLLKADYERAMETWLEEKREWEEKNGKDPDELVPATKSQAMQIGAQLNGNLNAEALAEELAKKGLCLKTPSTTKRWIKEMELARRAN